MGKKAVKSTRKFAASGQLKKTIQARKKQQDVRRKIQGRKTRRDGKGKQREHADADDEEENDDGGRKAAKAKGTSVDDLLGAGFMVEDENEDISDDAGESGGSEDEDEDDLDDDQSFASVDDLEEEGEDHLVELSKLAEKDPEFFKYLQENDRELLDFNPKGPVVDDDFDEEEDVGDDDAAMEQERAPALTNEILRKWQKALLDQRSLRALRKLLVAFRSAAHMNEDDQEVAWSIDSSSVYNKLVTTALRYTPVVMEHHVPYKVLADGRFKPPPQSPKQRTLGKLILSFFYNIIHVMGQLSEPSMIELAVSGSARLLPYVTSSRKAVKQYLKACLELWATAEDSTRIAAILAVRRLVSSTDVSILDTTLKGTYLTLVRSSKTTTAHTLPAINLMKNSASEIYCMDHATAYQHAFGYIRQLAIHLRNSMKVKTKEAYKQVYNWQFVHSIDFWAIVLARACDTEAEADRSSGESELKALIYPLVQVTLGAIKLISAPRSFPFHFHLTRSLLHLMQHTRVYIPISPYLLPILTSALSPTQTKKSSTLKPLDMETHIRAPQQYLKTRVYSEALAEEATFLLAEWLASAPVQGSIAFPEVVVPVVVVLRKAIKHAKNKSGRGGPAKEAGMAKALVERVEESAKWVEQRRTEVAFSPGQIDEVARWEAGIRLEDAPLAKYVKVQRKAREKRRLLVEKAREGRHEIVDSE